MGCRGPALAFVGYSGPALAIVGPHWLLWAFVGLRWPAWALVGTRRTPVGSIKKETKKKTYLGLETSRLEPPLLLLGCVGFCGLSWACVGLRSLLLAIVGLRWL